MAASYGFFGKLPARGDFVSAGLTRGFVAPWDAWLRRVLPAVLASLAEVWDDAPVWRFHLAAGVCGTEAVLGVLLPSRDRAGRRFPLTLACVAHEAADESLAVAERVGREAIKQELTPEQLGRLAADIRTEGYAVASRIGSDTTLWSTAADAENGLVLTGLPDLATFMTMLRFDDNAKQE